jgi:hypothetical protein
MDNQYINTNAVFILTVTIPRWRFMIFNIDKISPNIQRDFRIQTMVGSSLPPVVVRGLMSYYLYLLADNGFQRTLCLFFVFGFYSLPCVTCSCQFL